MPFEKGSVLHPRSRYPGAIDEFENSASLFAQFRADQIGVTFGWLFVHRDGQFRLRLGDEVIEGEFGKPFPGGSWEREFSLGVIRIVQPGTEITGVLRHDTEGFLSREQLTEFSSELALAVGLTKIGNRRTPLLLVTTNLLLGFLYNFEYQVGDTVLPVWPNRREEECALA